MKISFATTCMGRLHHLKQTLPVNLADNPPRDGVNVEFVVLNYNSSDGMREWMMGPDVAPHIESGRVVYAENRDAKVFHAAHAKNQAHRLTTGDIVCNLDADNYTGPEFANFLAAVFSHDPDCVLSPSRKALDEGAARGSFGRISMQRKNFLRVGGYGEEYMGRWGGEDSDMLFRAIASGLSLSRFEDKQFLRVIDHPNEDRVRNMVDEQGFESALADANKKSKRDKVRLMQNIFRYTVHNVQANKGSNFGIGRLHVGLEGESVDLGPANVARTSALNLTGFHLPGIVLDLRHPHIISAQEELKAFHQQPAI